MFELRPPKDITDLQAKSTERPQYRNRDFLEEIRRRSSAFVEDEDSDNDGDFERVSRRAQQFAGGTFGEVDGSAEDGEAAEFGDDEGDGEEVQNVGVGLGLDGRPL